MYAKVFRVSSPRACFDLPWPFVGPALPPQQIFTLLFSKAVILSCAEYLVLSI